jgi:hypothetical protein
MKTRIAISICLLAVAPLAISASQGAQKIIVCKDASGRTLTSDRPIPECAGNVKELDRNGVVRREVKPPPTPEELKKVKAEEEKKKADEIAAAELKRSDMAMQARFRSEDDIALARKRDVDLVADQVKRETATLANHEKRKKELEVQLGQAKGKKELVAPLERSIAEQDQSIQSVKKKLQDYDGETQQINAKYDATLKRFRELNAAAAKK